MSSFKLVKIPEFRAGTYVLVLGRSNAVLHCAPVEPAGVPAGSFGDLPQRVTLKELTRIGDEVRRLATLKAEKPPAEGFLWRLVAALSDPAKPVRRLASRRLQDHRVAALRYMCAGLLAGRYPAWEMLDEHVRRLTREIPDDGKATGPRPKAEAERAWRAILAQEDAGQPERDRRCIEELIVRMTDRGYTGMPWAFMGLYKVHAPPDTIGGRLDRLEEAERQRVLDWLRAHLGISIDDDRALLIVDAERRRAWQYLSRLIAEPAAVERWDTFLWNWLLDAAARGAPIDLGRVSDPAERHAALLSFHEAMGSHTWEIVRHPVLEIGIFRKVVRAPAEAGEVF
jgi:hypothetical protein